MGFYPVYVVDDDISVLESLSFLLKADSYEYATFDNPITFVNQAKGLAPGSILLDLQMPHLSGLELHSTLLSMNIHWPMIVLTAYGDLDNCRRAFKAGAVDFLSKPAESETVLQAIRSADEKLAKILEDEEAVSLYQQLTDREREIVDLICQGYTSKQIGLALDISTRTVDTHRANINNKWGKTSVADFVHIKMAQSKF